MQGKIKFDKHSYRVVRGFQISFVFSLTILVQEMFRYPHAGWSGFAVMMIYGGFDNGTTITRAYHRCFGVLLGLCLGYVIWIFGHIDYRLLNFLVPLSVFFVYFWAATPYYYPTTFTVSSSVVGFGYFDPLSPFVIGFYGDDYAMCTIIGFAVLIVCEYFWFKRYGMMQRFIQEIQISVINNLYNLVALLNGECIRRRDWFRCCDIFSNNLFEMERLRGSYQFMARSESAVGDEFNEFYELTNKTYVHLKALYIAYHTEHYGKFDYNQLVLQVQSDLKKLKSLVTSHLVDEVALGEQHAALR